MPCSFGISVSGGQERVPLISPLVVGEKPGAGLGLGVNACEDDGNVFKFSSCFIFWVAAGQV